MTRQELCTALEAPADLPPGGLLAAWDRRRADLGASLAQGGQAKPVKMRLREELRRLQEAEGVAAQLRLAAEIDRYLEEFDTESAKPAPTRGVLQLCLEKVKPLVPRLTDEELRFVREKRLAETEGRLVEAAASPPAPMAPSSGTTLELVPLAGESAPGTSGPPIRVVASPRFTLGRLEGADFPARFLPESEENRRKTSTISRVNATFFLRGRQIWVQDGQMGENGTVRPSRNGTVVDDQRLLRTPVPLDLSRERRLKLGQFGFEVRAAWLPPAAPRASGARPPAPPGGMGGCVRFSPPSPGVDSEIVIWILSSASLGSGPSAAIRLGRSLPAVAARLHHGNGRFWLETPPASKSVLCLDGRPLAAGEFVSLQAAHQLRLGPLRYSLRIR